MSFYRTDHAFVHDGAFGDDARHVAPEIVRLLARASRLATATTSSGRWALPASPLLITCMIHSVDRNFMLVGALAAFIGVALGAFGAHGLRSRLSTEMLNVFEVGVRYQMYHAFAVLIVGLIRAHFDGALFVAAGWLFTAGIVLFSGSLYLLALTGTATFGAITPIGGLLFLIGWACLAIAAI